MFRYCAPDGTIDEAHNPNGSANGIAGVRNAAGNVVGPDAASGARRGPGRRSTGGQPLFASLLAQALARV